MFETLFTFIKDIYEELSFCKFLYDYEVGVTYRYGIYHHEMKKGINWKIPVIEEFKNVSAQDDTKQLKSQTVEDHDGLIYTATPVVTFYVKNARKYFRNVLSNQDSIVDDIVASIVAEHMKCSSDVDLNMILKNVRESCYVYGYKVRDISFATYAPIKTLRLIHDNDYGVES